MQQIKAPIRKHNPPPVAFLAAKPQNRFRNSKNPRVQRNSMKAHATTSLWQDEKLVYHAGKARRFRSENPILTQFPASALSLTTAIRVCDICNSPGAASEIGLEVQRDGPSDY
jgi:hypothetical protein